MIYLLLLPALVISAFILAAFGWIGLCGITDCLGSGHVDWDQRLLGALFILLALLPLLATLFLLFRYIRRKGVGRGAKVLIWLLVAMLTILGAISVLHDPGDAMWAGLPPLSLAMLLGNSLWLFPSKRNGEQAREPKM